MKKRAPALFAFLLCIALAPSARADDDQEGDVNEEVFSVLCDCLINNDSVGHSSFRSAARQHSRWQQEGTKACKAKYGREAFAGSCDSEN